MIYQLEWQQLKRDVDYQLSEVSMQQTAIAETIKLADPDDYFVMIITKYQNEDSFQKFLKDYDLKQFIAYEMPYYVSNINRIADGRRLKIYVLSKTKIEQGVGDARRES